MPRDPSNSVDLAMFHASQDAEHPRGNPMTLSLDCIEILNPEEEADSVPYHLQDWERSTEELLSLPSPPTNVVEFDDERTINRKQPLPAP